MGAFGCGVWASGSFICKAKVITVAMAMGLGLVIWVLRFRVFMWLITLEALHGETDFGRVLVG